MTPGKRPLLSPNEGVVRATEQLWVEAQAAGVSQDKFVEAVLEAIDESIPSFVTRLLRDAPAMLRNRRRMARGFERRLKKRWGRALNLYRVTLEVALEAGSDFNEGHRPTASNEKDFLFEALARLHGRACLTASEIHVLLRMGYSDAACARWRTLHELAVVANVLVDHGQGNDLAERYLLHERAEQAWDAQSYQEHAPKLGYEPFTDAEMEQLRRTRDELASRFGPKFARPNGWACSLLVPERPPTFSQLEEMAGMAHMQPWYKYTSHRVHAGSKAAALGIKARGPHRFLTVGPTNTGLADPGHGALIALVQVTLCFVTRTRTETIPEEPFRLVISKALLQLTDRAGVEFLAAHKKLEQDEKELWV